MGTAVLKGISTGLLVTVLTLLAGIIWTAMDLGGLNVSTLVDIGLFVSCLVGGYRAGKESGNWVLGGAAGAGYVAVTALLLALFSPLQPWGVVKVLLEGALLGSIAGAFGAGGSSYYRGGSNNRGASPRRPIYRYNAWEDDYVDDTPDTQIHYVNSKKSSEDWSEPIDELKKDDWHSSPWWEEELDELSVPPSSRRIAK